MVSSGVASTKKLQSLGLTKYRIYPMYVVNRPLSTLFLLSLKQSGSALFGDFLIKFVLFEMYNYLINFWPALLGAPLQLGAVSARLVRLWVNPALATYHYCERNFVFLNWFCTRTCGAGRPHAGLCHALLVYILEIFFGSGAAAPGKSPGKSHLESREFVGEDKFVSKSSAIFYPKLILPVMLGLGLATDCSPKSRP